MVSIVWTGDRTPTQGWGWTTVTAEPWYSTPTFSGYFHCGIDIPMNTGEPLRAARAGVVAAVGTGYLAIGVGSEMDWYLHGTYVVSRGQAIARGQLLGAAGNIAPPGGASFGSHLHFERQSTLALQCNFPSTSRDPVPVLTGLFSGGSGSLGDDMSALSDKLILRLAARVAFIPRDATSVDGESMAPYFDAGAAERAAAAADQAAVAKLLALASAGSVAGSGLSAAEKAELDAVLLASQQAHVDATAVRAQLAKDLANP